MSSGFRISVAIPVYNEERVIPELLRRVRLVLDKIPGGPHEIMLVDDGSSDRTFDIVTDAAAQDPRSERFSGNSKYSFMKLLALAFNGIFAFSVVPLRMASIFGLLTILCSCLYTAYAIYVKVILGQSPQGFTALIVVITFLSGVQLLFLGVIGEYLGRVYEETKCWPHYIVGKIVGRCQVDAEYALNYRELYENHWWWRARERFILATIEGLRPQGNWGSILDVGCGEGVFFDRLSKFGEVEGVESNPSLAIKDHRWKQRIHVSAFDATFETNKQYSLILMLDVLEHFANPTVALRRSEELLDVKGSLVITVPAFSCLWTTHDDLNHHVSRFTKQSLAALISHTSLRIHAFRYFFHWAFPVKMLIHCKELCFRTDPVIPKVPARKVNALLYRLSIFEQAVFRTVSLPFGSSLLAVCTKH